MDLKIATSLLCYQCGKLYESIFDSEEGEVRVPILGSCIHTICILCLSSLNSQDCLICEKKNAFENLISNKTAQETFQNIRNHDSSELTMEIIEIREGSCSICKQVNQKLHFCKDCVQSEDDRNMKISSTGKWILLPSTTIVSFSCEQCILNSGDHQDHELIAIEDVENVEDYVSISYFLPLLHHDKLPSETAIEYFGKALNNLESLKEISSKESHSCDFHEKIRKELRNVAARSMDLKKREIVFHQENLKKCLSSFECELTVLEEPEQVCRLQNALEKLRSIQIKLEDVPENWLDLDTIKAIDEQLEEKMKKLEIDYKKESFIQIEEVEGYFKLNSLKKELKQSHDEVQKATKALKQTRKDVAEYLEKQKPILLSLKFSEIRIDGNMEENSTENDRIKYVETFQEIIEMDESAETYRFEKMKLKLSITLLRKKYAELMVLKYFPRNAMIEVLDFFHLIQQYKLENNID